MTTPLAVRTRQRACLAALAVLALPIPAATDPTPAPSPSAAAQTFGIVPSGPDGPDGRSAFDYKLDPGAQLADAAAVVNPSTEPLTLEIYAHDAITTEDGGFDIGTPTVAPVDAGSWVTFPAGANITVPARSRIRVPFALAVPGNATPGDHAAGIVAVLNTANGDGVVVARRVGVRMHLRISGSLAPQLSVENLTVDWSGSWNPFAGGTVTATYTIRNTGNLRLAAAPVLDIDGPLGIPAGRGGTDTVPQILPGQAVSVTVTAPNVWPLVYLSVAAQAVPGAPQGAQPVSGATPGFSQANVWAPPWPQLILLVLLVAAVWPLLWWRGRLRKRPATKQTEVRPEAKETVQ